MCSRQLYALLNHPDRICAAARRDAIQFGGGKVRGSCPDATIELICYYLLSITDRADGYYADHVGPRHSNSTGTPSNLCISLWNARMGCI